MSLTSFSRFTFCYFTLRLLADGMEEFLIQPTAWYYVRYLGQSNFFLGILLAAFPFGALISAPLVGALDVRYNNPKLVFLMCCLTKFLGDVLYTISINAYLPLVGRLISGLGEGTVGVLYGAVTQGTNKKNRVRAFLYFEALFSVGTAFGPVVGSFITFNLDIFGMEINAGNSPAVVLASIWFIMLILTVLLPSDLTGKQKNAVESSDSRKEESESESESATTNDTREYSTSRICCLYFVIFLSWILFCITSFYTPLLAAHHLGLGLVEIKFMYANVALFSFVLFLGNYIFSSYISEKCFIGFGIASHSVPLLILLYFALTFNDTLPVNIAYSLLILLLLLSVSFVIFPLASSLLSKETPVHKASFYQSLAFTVLHTPNLISRVVGGVTFNQTGMICVCLVLTAGWFLELIWFLIEYRALYPSSKKDK